MLEPLLVGIVIEPPYGEGLTLLVITGLVPAKRYQGLKNSVLLSQVTLLGFEDAIHTLPSGSKSPEAW